MKKFFKSILSLALLVFVVVGLTACKTPISSTTVDISKTMVGGKSSNGGTAVVYGDYLYYINGTQTNDGTNGRGVTQGAICKIKYDAATGEIEKDAEAEIVVSDLVGYEDGSIYIFGDFLYYTTPNNEVNYQGTTLYGKTDFKRYDLVNGGTYGIYTTYKNDSSETVEYAYYIVADDLYLVVYENVSKTLTSIKIGDSCETVYKISDVESCMLSSNNGLRVDENVVDANNFVFYTKAPSIEVDGYDEGSKVYKTAPNKNNSVWMGNKSTDDEWCHNIVKLLAIKGGKLIYSDESVLPNGETLIYAQSIGENSKLEFKADDVISSNPYNGDDDMIMFSDNGSDVSIIAYSSSSYQIVYIQKESGENVPHRIIGFDEETTVDFVSLEKIKEIKKDDAGTVLSEDEVEYLIYTVTDSSNVSLYKLEVKRNGVVATSPKLEQIVDSSEMLATNGLIMPKTIGNNIFVIAKDSDKNAYLYMLDISKEVDSDNKLVKVGNK